MRLLLALSTTFVLLAAGELVLATLGRTTVFASAARVLVFQGWLLESLAFVTVARLLVGRAGVVLDGLMVAGVVWVLRWPLLALTAAQLRLGPTQPWGEIVRDRLMVAIVVGLTLAWIYRRDRAES